MGDHRVALLAEPVDQAADAGLVLRIGALELVDLGVDQRFQLNGACQRALDAFAHGRDFAAHGLADHHDAVLGDVFRLGEPEGHLRHGLGGDAHVLGAAHHDREAPEEHQRDEHRHGQAKQHRLVDKLLE